MARDDDNELHEATEKATSRGYRVEEGDEDENHGQKRHHRSQLEVKMFCFKTFWYIVSLTQ